MSLLSWPVGPLSVSALLSNQHIPLSLDRHWETILAVHTQGGVTLISCPLTSDYTHTHSYCTVLLLLALKTAHSCSLNIQLFLCFEAAVTATLSTQRPSASHCPLPAWSCQSEPVVMSRASTDSPLSVLMTSIPPFLPPSLAPLGLQDWA